MSEEISSPKERNLITLMLSRITDWQRKHRGYVRKKLKDTQDDRVARNRARRILERSNRVKKCYKCSMTTNLRADHIDKNPRNNALSNLRWVCVMHDSNTKEKGTKDKPHQT